MAEAADKAKINSDGTYDIEWKSKPLGFSIVMDTSGKNAYVSSIQRAENVGKGLKLAAQIIQINGKDVENMKHNEILNQIKKATLPMTLRFKPRSFASEDSGAAKTAENDEAHQNHPRRLIFEGAPDDCTHVNGEFELLIKPINDKPAWQRKDEESDPILLWFWPKTEPENARLLKRDVWMIGRRSNLNKQSAYACTACSEEVPSNPKLMWKVYQKANSSWEDTKIRIQQKSL